MSSFVRCARVQLIAVSASALNPRDDSAQRGLFVVISLHHRTRHLLHDLDAFVGVRVVANDVAEADEMRAVALVRVGRARLRLPRDWREGR